jgi:hypothetical protein
MRKLALFSLLFLCIQLVGCNTKVTINSNQTSMISNNHQTTKKTTTIFTNPYVEMDPGQIEEFLNSLSQFQSKFQRSQQLSVETSTNTIVHGPSYSVESQSKSNLDLDLYDFYLLSTVYPQGDSRPNHTTNYLFEKNGQIHRFQHDSDYRIIRSVVLENITQNGIIGLLSQYGLSTDATMDYLGEIVQKTPYIYEAKIGFPYWEKVLGTDNVNFLKTLSNVSLNDEYIMVELSFNQNYTSYVQKFHLDVRGQLSNQYYRLELNITMSQTNTPIEKKSVSEMGFQIPVSITPEDIEFDSNPYGKYDIVENQDNWIRMYLKAGYYSLSFPDPAEVFLYDDTFQPISFSLYTHFFINHDGYYYLNMHKPYDFGSMYLYMRFMEYTDVVNERIHESQSGVITGYSESRYDVNTYTFSSASKLYLLSVEIDRNQTTIYRFDISLQHDLNECSQQGDPCYYYLTPQQEVTIKVYSKSPGTYVLRYRFIEAVSTPQAINDLHDVSIYNANNPFYVGWGVDKALFKFTINQTGFYAFYMNRYAGYGDWSYRVYDLSGNVIKPSATNIFELDIGTYIGELTCDAFGIFSPTINRLN